MVLPFVRDLFADVEKLPAFARVATRLRENTGRIRVSGLIPSAKALILVLLQKSLGRPLVVVVPDNRAAEELLPVLQAFGELVGGAGAETMVSLPTRDVLPFQALSPHPEIQEERAVTLWKIATGAVSIVVSPIAGAALRLRSAEYYADLARTVRRGETIDTEPLLRHLNTVGYAATDVVEMPGEYALRGGILDVYSPEADRPLRIEFFGDEVESIRKFDPATQRSSTPVDEALLLPLTETPVSEDLLGAIHARLSGRRITGAEEVVEQAVRSGGVTVFPGWEFYAAVAGADSDLLGLLPQAAVIVDEPESLKKDFDHSWARIAETHERSGVGNEAGGLAWFGYRLPWRGARRGIECGQFPLATDAALSWLGPKLTGDGKNADFRSQKGFDCGAKYRGSRTLGRHVLRVRDVFPLGQSYSQRRKLRR
jgi:transcription-repair coupling factor (superfamily II helicase)